MSDTEARLVVKLIECSMLNELVPAHSVKDKHKDNGLERNPKKIALRAMDSSFFDRWTPLASQ